MTPEALAGTLEDLLTRAEQSHLAYQQEHGDTDWPPYYADYLFRVLGTEFTLEQISTALREAATAHGEFEEAQGAGRDEAWAKWYAQHMAGNLSRDYYRWLAESESWEEL